MCSSLDDLSRDSVILRGFHHPMQEGIGNTPFLVTGDEGNCFIIETNHCAAAGLLISVVEAGDIANGDFMTA